MIMFLVTREQHGTISACAFMLCYKGLHLALDKVPFSITKESLFLHENCIIGHLQ